MAEAHPARASQPDGATGVIVFSDGRTIWGRGFGAQGQAVGELCFNTAMTGYQEVMTDPSYARQVIAFTFPHIGNVGANADDQEESSAQGKVAARGAVFKAPPTLASNLDQSVGVEFCRTSTCALSSAIWVFLV